LNQKTAQIYFNSRSKGTAQKMINKQALEELEIEIPSLNQQQKIVKIAQLAEKEQQLLENLRTKKSEYVSTILLNKIKEIKNGN
jgi:restriction endonuclease S subunit